MLLLIPAILAHRAPRLGRLIQNPVRRLLKADGKEVLNKPSGSLPAGLVLTVK
jgi:hypothetical protein